ncbi:MAG: tetratricopeptide repeat protein [Pseudomonadota bacterium]
MTEGEFLEILKLEETRAFFSPLADQIRQYTDSNLLSDDTAEDAYRRFFALVEHDTKNHWKLAESRREDSPSMFSSRIETMKKGRGDFAKTASVYYWFHLSADRADYADRIDWAAFKQPFADVAEIWRGDIKKVTATYENGLLVDLGSITLCFGRHQDQRSADLEWKDRGDIVKDGVLDHFAALDWKHQLIEDLVGRENDKKAVLDWAQDPAKKSSVRLISGPGGSGKTRLAAQVAKELAKRGWSAGFLRADLSRQPMISVSQKGLLLIVDYPEERSEQIERLLADVRETYRRPIRILLLSRFEASERRNRPGTELSKIAELSLEQPGGVEGASAAELVCAAANALAELMKNDLPPLEGAEAWVNQHYTHRLPLFAIAAGIHAALEPARAFQLGGSELMRELAERELRRVRAAWSKLDRGGERALERLLALGLFTGNGLDESQIREIAERDIGTELSGKKLIDAVRKTSWWLTEEQRLVRLEPDRPAAAFLALAVLKDDADDLPKWMVGPATSAGTRFGETLSRLLFDLAELSGDAYRELEESSLVMLELFPESLSAFESVAFQSATQFSVRFVAAVCNRLLNGQLEPVRRARLLNNLGSHFSEVGQHDRALSLTQEGTNIFRELATSNTDDALREFGVSLDDLAIRLHAVGKRDAALEVAEEAVQTLRRLAPKEADLLSPHLVFAISNLCTILFDAGRPNVAFENAKEALGMWRQLAGAEPQTYRGCLAAYLGNLSNWLAESGDGDSALAAAVEAVDIFRDLYFKRPDVFCSGLTVALGNLSLRLSRLGRYEAALAFALQEVQGRRDMANVRLAYLPQLAQALHNLSNRYAELGCQSARKRNPRSACNRSGVTFARRLTR